MARGRAVETWPIFVFRVTFYAHGHENLVEKIKIFVQDFVPIRTALRGRGIASSSCILFFYLLYWYYSYIWYFVCAPASEFGAMGSTSFLGFSYPNLPLVFLKILKKITFLYKILFP